MSSIQFFQQFSGEPFYNMAFDEWMLERAAEFPDDPLLRLYTWRTATITFGYNQRRESALDQAQVGGTPVIRRITGGRALLHDPSELTYSIAMNLGGALGGRIGPSLAETSGAIAEALQVFLGRVGRPAEYVRQSSPQNSRPDFFHKAPCFASTARYELTDRGRKIIASAQRREGNLLLQHGAIKLRGVASHPALPLPSEAAPGGLQPIDAATFETMALLFAQSFGAHFGLPVVTGTLGPDQLARVDARHQLVEKKACEQREISKRNPQSNSL
jgi:lipoate-protein ligase A